jgi:hypothetical protein
VLGILWGLSVNDGEYSSSEEGVLKLVLIILAFFGLSVNAKISYEKIVQGHEPTIFLVYHHL